MMTRKVSLILPLLCIIGIIGSTVPVFMDRFQRTIHGTVLENAVSSMPLLIALAGGVAVSLPLFVELTFDSYVKTSKKEHLHWYCRLVLLLDLFISSVIMIIYFHGVDGIANYERVRVLVLFTTFRFLLRLAVVLFYFNNCIQRSLMNTIHSVLILSIFIVSRMASVTQLVFPQLTVFSYVYYCGYAVGTAYFIAQTGMWIYSLKKRLSFSSQGNSSMQGGLHNGSIYLAGLIFEIVSFFVIPYFFSGSGRLSTFSAKSLAGKQYAQIIVTLITCTIPSRHSRDESLSRLADSRTKKSFKKYLSAEITRPLGTIALGLQVLEELVESLASVVPAGEGSSAAKTPTISLEMMSVDSSSEGEANSREKEISYHRHSSRPHSSGMEEVDRRHRRSHKDEDAMSKYNKKIQQIIATKQSCDTALKQLQRLLQQDRFDNGILALELEYVKLVPFLVGTLKAVVNAVNSDTKTPRLFRYDIGTNSQLDSVQPRYRDVYVKVDRQYMSEVIKAVVVQALRVASAQSEVFFELVVIDNYDSLSLSNMLKLSVNFEAALSRPEHVVPPRHAKNGKSDMSPSSSTAMVLPFRSGPHGDDDSFQSMEEGERLSRANPLQGPRILTLMDMFESTPGAVQGRTKRTAHTSPTHHTRLDEEVDSDTEDLPDGVAPAATTRYVPSGVKGCGSILSQHLAEEILKLHDGAVTGTSVVSSGTGGEISGVMDIVNKSIYNIELPYFKQILLHNNSVDYDEDEDEYSPPQVWSRPVSRQLNSSNNSRENSAQRKSYHSTGANSLRKNGTKPSPNARKGPHAAMKSLPAIRSFRHKVVPNAVEGDETLTDAFDPGL